MTDSHASEPAGLALEHERLQHRDYVMGLLAEVSSLREADRRLRADVRRLEREVGAKTARLEQKNKQLVALRERLRDGDGRLPSSDHGA